MNRLLTAMLALAVLAALALPGLAAAKDRDRDGLPDRWEKQNRLSGANGRANADPDRDGVDNRNELREGTKPRTRDSDGDRRPDGREDADHDKLTNAAEDASGNDPIDSDTDDDGIVDGKEQAGVVTSFAGGVLTIDVANGGRIAGTVDEATEVSCRSEVEAERGHRGANRKALGRGKRGRGRGGRKARGRGSVVAPAARAAQGEEENFLGDEEDFGGEEDFGDEEGDEEDFGDEDFEDDEDLGDEGDLGDEALGGASCAASSIKPGTGVTEAELDLDEEGAWFSSVTLLR
jgi:hypothetical protein